MPPAADAGGPPRCKRSDRGWPLREGVKNRNSDSEEESGTDHMTREERKRERDHRVDMRMIQDFGGEMGRIVDENKRLKEEAATLKERVATLERERELWRGF